ncbi:hypothetical protein GCM10027174_29220 [Salinifilum aidingensis]
MDSSVQVPVTGAGTPGCGTAHDLARLGIADVAAAEQLPLLATGGSTSHTPESSHAPVLRTGSDRSASRLAADAAATAADLELDEHPRFHRTSGAESSAAPGVEASRSERPRSAAALADAAFDPAMTRMRC